ncbi:MAG: ABC-2 family transporter protein [Peptoniphilaceae bacterium]|nr:ABC-2 family transporter protein [Peptoniphilaceae bacterium]
MKSKFNIRKRLIKIGFLVNQIYKEAIVIRIISDFLFIIMQYYIWRAIYKTNTINSFTFTEMISYIIISKIIVNILPGNVSSDIGYKIKTGDILFSLLTPYSFTEIQLFENIGKSLFKLLVINIPLYLAYFLIIGINIQIIYLLEFILLISLTYIFYFFFELLFGVIYFYTNSQWGIQNLKYAVLLIFSGKIIPIKFYPSILYKISNFLPFKYFINVPILTLLGKNNNFIDSIIILSINILIIFMIFNITYKMAIKRLTIQGG